MRCPPPPAPSLLSTRRPARPRAAAPRALAGGAASLLLLGAIAAAAPVAAGDGPSVPPPPRPVPPPSTWLGYEPGEGLATHEKLGEVLRGIAASSPRVRLETYGTSEENRALYLAIVTAPDRLSHLDEILRGLARLSDPRITSPSEEARLVEDLPAVVWLNFGNDGNESAAVEAAMEVLHDLAAGTDEDTVDVLRNLLVILTPCQNPESHERQVVWSRSVAVGSPDPQAAEHQGAWGLDTNFNHFHFDLNRDAHVLTQRESRALVTQLLRFHPQVFVDHHGQLEHAFFPPAPQPLNRHLSTSSITWMERFGAAAAREFDARGWSFFTREVFDMHFPGYWDVYPALHGAVGMTFETNGGGQKGFRLTRDDGTEATLEGGIERHVVYAHAVLREAARGRRELLAGYAASRRESLESPVAPRAVAWSLDPDPAAATDLAALLLRHGIEVHIAGDAIPLAQAEALDPSMPLSDPLPPGSFLVDLRQPEGRLARALLERDAPLDESFLAKVRERRERNRRRGRREERESLGFYDVTAWSLPLAFRVRAFTLATLPEGPLEPAALPLAVEPLGDRLPDSPARQGYLIPWGSLPAARTVFSLWDGGYRLAVARESFRIHGRDFAAGTIVVPAGRNEGDLHEWLGGLQEITGAAIVSVDSAVTEEGIDLGSGKIEPLPAPSIAVAMGEPADETAYGAIWFLLERKLGYPFTPLPARDLVHAKLADYDVLILPDGDARSWVETLGEEGASRLRRWIEDGGSLLALCGAAEALSDPGIGLLSVAPLPREQEPPAGDDAPADAGRGDRPECPKRNAGDGSPPPPPPVAWTPGALLRATRDPDELLAAGFPASFPVLWDTDRVFPPTREGRNVVRLAGETPLRLSGYVAEGMEATLAGKPYLLAEPLGEGSVIAFTQDPVFRLAYPGLWGLLLSAIAFAPTVR